MYLLSGLKAQDPVIGYCLVCYWLESRKCFLGWTLAGLIVCNNIVVQNGYVVMKEGSTVFSCMCGCVCECWVDI